ncbi:histidine kinase [uncultured Parabacteroides sp.]|uniref:sensor histidine kinase n=1 Tax=uncultured Parabacteroides sp. TaxID=512312 RepID=UPI00261BA891|nr:histidine kinase [uncultured Parabacteroides sp.]
MVSLDEKLSVIKDKPWLVGLVCAVFVAYPNLAWIFCDMSYLAPDSHQSFLLFFLFRFLFFWGLIWLLLKSNLRHENCVSFFERLLWNVSFAFGGFVVYKLISYLTVNYDRFLSIVIFQFIVLALLCTLIGYIQMLYHDQRVKEQLIENLRIENLQSRCDALVNQINPHFFFNSLNGISSLIRKKNDENTLLYVTKLSDIFRYILQSDKKNLVPLSEELAFIEAFRHVMEVRFANKLTFTIEVPEDKRSLRIPVLSLLPLVENVTVHNIIDSEHRMDILIRLNERMELVVSNPVYPKLTLPDTNGTGLKNLENRFLLLMNKQIRVESDENKFRVYLPLK